MSHGPARFLRASPPLHARAECELYRRIGRKFRPELKPLSGLRERELPVVERVEDCV